MKKLQKINNNWATQNDIMTIYNNQSSIIKPAQFPTGGNSSITGQPTNYIPGYTRLSTVTAPAKTQTDTSQFLIMHRVGSRNNVAFIIYKKMSSRSDFANDIYNNHPDLVNKIITQFYNPLSNINVSSMSSIKLL